MSGDEIDSVQAIPLTIYDTALTGTYAALNGTGTPDNIKILKAYNGSTTVGVIISFDGVTDHDYWPPGATLIVDFEANHYSINGSGTKYIRAGQILWGKTTATPNAIFISGFR